MLFFCGNIKAVYIEIQCKENKTFYFNIHTIKNN